MHRSRPAEGQRGEPRLVSEQNGRHERVAAQPGGREKPRAPEGSRASCYATAKAGGASPAMAASASAVAARDPQAGRRWWRRFPVFKGALIKRTSNVPISSSSGRRTSRATPESSSSRTASRTHGLPGCLGPTESQQPRPGPRRDGCVERRDLTAAHPAGALATIRTRAPESMER